MLIRQLHTQLRSELSERRQKELAQKVLVDGIWSRKRIYKYMQARRRPPGEVRALKGPNEAIARGTQEIQELLAGFWETVYDKGTWHTASENLVAEMTVPDDVRDRLNDPITILEVAAQKRALQNGVSAGTTHIPQELIKHAPPEWLELATDWANQAVNTQTLPTQMNKSEITMLHKKGRTDVLNNYRTIAVGCNLCKFLLRVIEKRISWAAEQAGLFGKIQCGFRAAHRGMENLLVLEAAVREMRKKKKEVYAALLDITKAYDRVCRDTLWQKLREMNFPPELIGFLQATYAAPVGVIDFQGVKSTELEMHLGLRQGCVLSPVLFALYIADLGRLLEQCGRGVTLNGTIIPALFFADDMIVLGDADTLQHLLNIIGEYAQKAKIQFAGHKSQVVPFHRDADPQKEWTLGYTTTSEGNIPIVIKEVDEAVYLGMQFGRPKQGCSSGIFHPHLKKMLNKANLASKEIINACRGVAKPALTVQMLWRTYALPSFLYGMDIAAPTQGWMEEINKITLRTLRVVLRVPPYTPSHVLWGESGLMPVEYYLIQHKLGLWQFFDTLPEDRYAADAFKVETSWHNNPAGPHPSTFVSHVNT